MTASSPGEGKGSVFTITLPCARSRPRQRADKFKTPQKQTGRTDKLKKLTGIRVLIIDDLEETRKAFSVILESCGALTRTAATAGAGVAALAQFKPDVVLCDIAMPHEDGFSFIRKVRALKPGQGGKTPAVALTAYVGAENVRQALDAGFDAHVAKPADAVDLSRVIAKLAGRGKT